MIPGNRGVSAKSASSCPLTRRCALHPPTFGQLSTGPQRERIIPMPRTTTRLVALGAAAVAVAIAATPAAARSTLVDDDAADPRAGRRRGPPVRRATTSTRRPGRCPCSARTGRSPRCPPRPSSGAAPRAWPPSCATRSRRREATTRSSTTRARRSGARQGDDARRGLRAPRRADRLRTPATGPLARRVHLYVSPAAGAVLTDSALRGVRTALARSGGLWLEDLGVDAASSGSPGRPRPPARCRRAGWPARASTSPCPAATRPRSGRARARAAPA